jgi:hypothetical protein
MKTKGITERFSINLHSFSASIWAFKKTGQVKATLYPSAAVPAGVLGQLFWRSTYRERVEALGIIGEDWIFRALSNDLRRSLIFSPIM